ncbi:MAG: hypothetical protein COU46_01385 [Candidatus Niyogibacteria bacterium CG10_big_fil_rev_8_21_14_0_10_42_19]|uniref:Uncharacterized protein n=1 Tax=Candidatus Niyogibacteria bacterium CG10_big_fil_rev_8_21_14_0_10_42_19 TaxID=1974725 RepID=A0A2H0TFW2_9BACT|nr:MAG: hypothetical protein COU46_01385 [Candidatus Niyogibacteria bacterium CG10_big_fil_rev_8_21_14_0_10_42_19]
MALKNTPDYGAMRSTFFYLKCGHYTKKFGLTSGKILTDIPRAERVEARNYLVHSNNADSILRNHFSEDMVSAKHRLISDFASGGER